ncbi:MAG: hypothetical protein K5656_10655 [Lachnospiraceae bacterium]|nr:hypothetical protein [Lachnospiraceae bacterium]
MGILDRIKTVYATEIVAVTYDGRSVTNFEQGDAFWIYAIDEDKVVRMQILSLYSRDVKDVIEQMRRIRVDTIISKNFGGKAMSELKSAGFKIVAFDGGAKAAVKKYAAGEIREL